MFQLHHDGVPAFRLQSLDRILQSLHVAGGAIRRGGLARFSQASQLLDSYGFSAPDGEQPFAAGRRGYLDVEDVERLVRLDESERAGVLKIALGIQQVQVAGRADVEDGHVPCPVGA